MKKTIWLALCISLLLGCARAAVCVRMDDTALLLRADGGQLVPPGEYGDIVRLNDELFAARPMESKYYALMDEQAQLLTEAQYQSMLPGDDILLVEREGLWGAIGADGTSIISPVYTRILCDGEYFWALRENPNDSQSDEIFMLYADGSEHATGVRVHAVGETGEGLLPVLEAQSGLWGYMNGEGDMQIAARFRYASQFRNGCAGVVDAGGYGAIDASGNYIIEPKYDYLEISPAGFVLAARAQLGIWVFDMKGNEIAAFEGEERSAFMAGDGFAVTDGIQLEIFGSDGERIAQLNGAASVSAGLDGQLIIADGAWGEECVYLNGTESKYQHLYPLGILDGVPAYACMHANSARYINDMLGEVQISVDMESARYGVVDGDGVLRIPIRFESIEAVGEDRLLARNGDHWQLLDIQGNVYWEYGIMQTGEPSF